MTQHRYTSKLRSTATKLSLGVCAALAAIASPLQLAQPVFADRYDDQINAIRNQVKQYQAKASELNKQASSLQATVSALTADKNAIQAQLDLSQVRLDKLNNDIEVNKKKLADNQVTLGRIIANAYVDEKITPLEMLASSKNVGDYMDQHTYRSAASEKLGQTIEAVRTLKLQLETDQKQVAVVIEEQKTQRATLTAKEAEQQVLLDQTKGEEAAYQQQITKSKNDMAEVAAQQRAALAAATNGGRNNSGTVGSFQFRNYSGNSPCGGGGYPLCGGKDAYVDEWDLYNQECVSYAAWAAQNRFGKRVSKFAGAGHAYQWPSTTTRMGATTNRNPEVGSIAVIPQSGFAPLGHVMVVEAILGGGWVHVTQYNFGGTGEYSTMDIHASGANFVHFQDR